jgi:hypothetical protein
MSLFHKKGSFSLQSIFLHFTYGVMCLGGKEPFCVTAADKMTVTAKTSSTEFHIQFPEYLYGPSALWHVSATSANSFSDKLKIVRFEVLKLLAD